MSERERQPAASHANAAHPPHGQALPVPSARARWRTTLRLWAPASLLTAVALLWASRFIEAPPPHTLRLATGPRGGAYHAFGLRYRQVLARSGVRLELIETQGSIENLRRLLAGELDLAFVQGGTSALVPGAGKRLVSLGSVYSEALWCFYRAETPIERLNELRGRKIAIGKRMSGTAAVTRMLLALNGVDHQSATVLPLGAAEAAAALRRGDLDAAFLVASPQAPVVRSLLAVPEIRLLNFRRHQAYARRIPYLERIDLPEGILDLAANMPTHDTILLAPTANLAAVRGLHPAAVQLVLEAAREIHGPGGILDQPGAYPNRWHLELPLDPAAERYYRLGPTILSRYLPYWAVSLVRSAIVLLIPLFTILLPVIKFAPALYRWRMRVKIYRWYDVLQAIEETLGEHADRGAIERAIAHTERLQREVAAVSVPYTYMKEVYDLRMHIRVVRDELLARRAALACPRGRAPDEPQSRTQEPACP